MVKAGEKNKRTSEVRGLPIGLVVLFCIFAGLFLFLRSPFFSIREFRVQGNVRVSRDEIIARAGQDTANIFAFDVDKASRLIALSPWIEKVSVRRVLPGTIAIRVTERTPIAFTPARNGMWLVDASGRVLGQDDGSFAGLIAITGPLADLAPGQFLDASTYGWGLRVLAALGPLSRQKLTEVSVQDSEVALILDDGCTVLIGEEKADAGPVSALLESILQDLSKQGRVASRIDLRFEKPVVKEQFQKASER